MRILLVSSFLPYPLYSGGHIRLFNLIKHLSKKHKITLICEKRDYQDESDISEVKKICFEVITVKRLKQWTINNILKTGFSKNAFLITGHKNIQMRKAIDTKLKKEKYDLIHVETSYVYQNLPKNNLPIVLAEHNIEYLVYKRFAKKANFLLKPFLYLDVLKLRLDEEKIWKRVKKIITVSEIEKNLIGVKNVDVIPNGVDLDEFKFQKKDFSKNEKKVLFIGDFKWLQNTDALRQILLNIWPEVIKNTKKKIKLLVVGKNIPLSIKELNKFDNVIFDENNNKKTWEIYNNVDVLLAPIRAGGGTSFKILEAMATGVAVVTTELGVVGIRAEDKKHALVGSEPLDLARNIKLLLEDKMLFEKITVNARELIEKDFDWKKIAQKLDGVYNSAVSL